MKKYVNELKKVTFPKQSDVLNQFIIVLCGIIIFSLFFLIADTLILEIIQRLYS